MSKFNVKQSTKTENLAGGEAYGQTPQLELISILLTSFAGDSFYRSQDKTFERLKELIAICNKKFVAKASIYARTVYGMRSITHVVASELAKYISGELWAKNYYDKIVYRVDDMTEILSFYFNENKKLSKAIQKGFRLAFSKFNAYELAKYKSSNKKIKLIDAVNLVHPKPVNGNEQALKDLVAGKLKSFDTWETELSATQGDKEKKKHVWINLIKEKKIGYFALLRNLRNIIEQSPEIVDEALEMLCDEKLIKKSLVLPFRFQTAYQEIKYLDGKIARNVLIGISKAVDISLNNVPRFEGETLVVLDCSGSMSGRPAEIGSLFSAVLTKSNNADLILFSDDAEYRNINPLDSTLTIADSMHFESGGTNFHAIFETANKKYDRMIILSDMQGWIGYDTPVSTFNEYKKRYNADPFIYSFDLQNYGTLQFPERNIFCLAGFSDKVFDLFKYLESDKKALLNEVEKIEL